MSNRIGSKFDPTIGTISSKVGNTAGLTSSASCGCISPTSAAGLARPRCNWGRLHLGPNSFQQNFFEEIHRPLIAGLPEPEDRLFADGGVGVGLGDFDEQRH